MSMQSIICMWLHFDILKNEQSAQEISCREQHQHKSSIGIPSLPCVEWSSWLMARKIKSMEIYISSSLCQYIFIYIFVLLNGLGRFNNAGCLAHIIRLEYIYTKGVHRTHTPHTFMNEYYFQWFQSCVCVMVSRTRRRPPLLRRAALYASVQSASITVDAVRQFTYGYYYRYSTNKRLAD